MDLQLGFGLEQAAIKKQSLIDFACFFFWLDYLTTRRLRYMRIAPELYLKQSLDLHGEIETMCATAWRVTVDCWVREWHCTSNASSKFRLVIGGLDRVFEIGRNFRNEGIDLTHNPEQLGLVLRSCSRII